MDFVLIFIILLNVVVFGYLLKSLGPPFYKRLTGTPVRLYMYGGDTKDTWSFVDKQGRMRAKIFFWTEVGEVVLRENFTCGGKDGEIVPKWEYR